MGKSTGFSHLATWFYRLWAGSIHLFPHKSTQVVDFPHLTMVRHFLDANFANERELGKDIEQEETESSGHRNQYPEAEVI